MISLGSLFGHKPLPMIGLDISASAAKLVELARDKAGQLVLERCAQVPLEPGWINDGNIDKFDAVAEAVRHLIQKSASNTRIVSLALPQAAVITKKIVLPGGLPDLELESLVETEANQYIPFPLEEVNLDFCVIGPNAASAGEVDVLIAAARREKVQDFQGLAEAAGLKPAIVDIESYASRVAAIRLIERLPNRRLDSIVALFEIGGSLTSMQVLQGEEVLYERDQAFGGAELTQKIARQYGFSTEEAENKKRSGDLPGDYDITVLRPFVEDLTQEIGRTLQFFFTSTPHNKVDYILLAGGSAVVAGLPQAVTRQTTFDCGLANPFDGMKIGSAVRSKHLATEAPAYLTACGLALRRFTP